MRVEVLGVIGQLVIVGMGSYFIWGTERLSSMLFYVCLTSIGLIFFKIRYCPKYSIQDLVKEYILKEKKKTKKKVKK